MILIVTNERDLTTDYIVLELRRRNIAFCRLNSERLPGAKILFNPRWGEDGWIIEIDDRVINFTEVTAAYFRRPGTPSIPDTLSDSAVRRYCEVEWGAVLTSALNSLGDRWLNSPLAILAAENKPRQLSIAYKLGFVVPDTIITNDINYAQSFMSSGTSVGKPLREALLTGDDEERVIFTSRLEALDESDEKRVSAAPIIFQREIVKAADIRVTVVENQVYAVEILSQEHDETEVDWRRGSRPDLIHRCLKLPETISQKCVDLLRLMGLRFGAIDLALDTVGNYWFLEINPNGQWAWIETRTGLPLTQSIVDALERISA